MKLTACALLVCLVGASAGVAGVSGPVFQPAETVANCNPKIQRC